MEKTVCELFAGVGGFRCGLESSVQDNERRWNTVWFSQWEPGKKKQWAHDCYVEKFGDLLDINGNYTTGFDIAEVDKQAIPNHNLLVGGFPCQDYSVARGLSGEKGIEGKKGVLWWSIKDVLEAKKPPFIILENVDRLLKSPSKQRGRDFAVILACLDTLGYRVEWRVVNAADYGAAQRRRRIFIFAYKDKTEYAKIIDICSPSNIIHTTGFFAKTFPIQPCDRGVIEPKKIDGKDLVKVSDEFSYAFENAGYMIDGKIYTTKVIEIQEKSITLGEILQDNPSCKDNLDSKYKYHPVDEKYYINKDMLFYNVEDDDVKKRRTWQYLKGAKKIDRVSKGNHKYVFSEGPIAYPDPLDKPSRTMLTSESSFNRSTHVIKDPETGELRILTPIEAERLQGFKDDWTVCMPDRNRYFCMGNALVVDMIRRMGITLNQIFDKEK